MAMSISRHAFDPHDHGACIASALDAAELTCARHGARLTGRRRRVLELVWRSHRSVKAYDLLAQMADADPSVRPPTVYRALEFLIAQGLVHRIESLNAFVGCARPGQSHHEQFLICDGCGTVQEMEVPEVGRSLSKAASVAGFQAEHQTVEVRGRCDACSQSTQQP